MCAVVYRHKYAEISHHPCVVYLRYDDEVLTRAVVAWAVATGAAACERAHKAGLNGRGWQGGVGQASLDGAVVIRIWPKLWC